MAAEEEKQDQEQTQAEGAEGKKKSSLLSSLIFVTIGATLGAAGVVMLTPATEKQQDNRVPEPEYELREHPDPMKFLVNPQTERGRITARISFLFIYKLNKIQEDDVLESIQRYWNNAYSRCIVVIGNEDARFLATAQGKARLRKRLVDELTLTLFPDGIAIIDDILWTEYLLQ